MTQPPAIPPPPILDLRGPARRTLRRPGLAAVACWLLAAENAVLIAAIVPSYIREIPGVHWDPRVTITIQTVSSLIRFPLFAAGVIILAVADIAGGQINPWPRRLMAVIGVTASASLASAHIYYLAAVDRRSINLLVDYECFLLAGAILTVATVIHGLIYAMQIAGWLKSRSLATASALVQGLCLLYDAFQIPYLALVIAVNRRWVAPISRAVAETIGWSMVIFGTLLAAALICYWVVLARKLGKMRAAA